MKIGILGDIHGNIEALKVAYDAAVSNTVEKIYHVKSEFLRIPYDIEKVASAIIESGLPSCFAEKLRQGK